MTRRLPRASSRRSVGRHRLATGGGCHRTPRKSRQRWRRSLAQSGLWVRRAARLRRRLRPRLRPQCATRTAASREPLG
eukprot:1005535-Prymnesium_polylepis.1